MVVAVCLYGEYIFVFSEEKKVTLHCYYLPLQTSTLVLQMFFLILFYSIRVLCVPAHEQVHVDVFVFPA